MEEYLESTEYIDWKTPEVFSLAKNLTGGLTDDVDKAKLCFEWVRDEIRHTADYQLNKTTCKASDVLLYYTGFCYAKSHLLAALLRASGIPTGLCYQRLSVSGEGPPYSLHGLNAVYLIDYGWYRVDARGNKRGVEAHFSPPKEKLAFSLSEPSEFDLKGIFASPLPIVVEFLESYNSSEAAYDNLPDIERDSVIVNPAAKSAVDA